MMASILTLWLLLGLLIEFWLARRQSRYLLRHGTGTAANPDDVCRTDSERTVSYNRARLWLRFGSSTWQLLLVLGWTLGGGLTWLAQGVHNDWLGGMLLLVAFAVGQEILRLPPSLLHTFYVEKRFGFNRARPLLIARDTLLKIGIASVAAAFLGLLLLPPILTWDGLGWLLAVLLVVASGIIYLWAKPRILAPLFNHFHALPAGSLSDRLQAMVKRCGARADHIFIMDNSTRSARANAYFSGLGRSKRIVLFDTLLNRLDEPEIEAVLAHELGHDRLGHILRYYTTLAVLLVGGMLLLVAGAQSGLLTQLSIATRPASVLAAGYLLLPAVAWPLKPWLAARLRRYEFEADAYAARHTDARALISALQKLMTHNAASAGSDPLYMAFYASHPPLEQRLKALAYDSSASIPD